MPADEPDRRPPNFEDLSRLTQDYLRQHASFAFGHAFKPDLTKLETQLLKDVEQIRRQQVHIDEIKRLCHVKPQE